MQQCPKILLQLQREQHRSFRRRAELIRSKRISRTPGFDFVTGPEIGGLPVRSNLPDVTFVVPKNNPALFERNFAASPCFESMRPGRILAQEGYSSAASAYNDAIEKAQTDLIVFAHQDVFFPANWLPPSVAH